MHEGLLIPSPLQRISYPSFAEAGIEFWLKRDDKIHPAISGNKWRKLVHNFREAKKSHATGIVTFGGAFSNHLAATAFAAAREKIPMVAFIRGLDSETTNPTLDFLKACGTTIIPLSRTEYDQKNEPDFLAEVQTKFPGHAIIPEGGANLLGVGGCMDILDEVHAPFDIVATPVGTATTLSGLLLSGFPAAYIGFTAVKGGAYLTADVNNFINRAKQGRLVPPTFPLPEFSLQTDYHFGGFGKVTPELIAFMNAFYQETGVPLDPIYTGKMVFGLAEMASQRQFTRGTRILALHTGGLQGIFGMNERLRKKNLRIIYEEAVDYPFPPAPW